MSEGLGRERAMQPAMQSLGGFTAPLMCECVRLGKMFSSRHVPVWQVPGSGETAIAPRKQLVGKSMICGGGHRSRVALRRRVFLDDPR